MSRVSAAIFPSNPPAAAAYAIISDAAGTPRRRFAAELRNLESGAGVNFSELSAVTLATG
jgi:hypothetical protein